MLSGGSGVFATSSATAMSGLMSETSKNATQNKKLSLTSDKLHYSDISKDVKVSGKVNMKYEEDLFQTETIYGNIKEEKYVLPKPLKWTRKDFEINAKKGEYYGKSANANLEEIDGNYQDIYYFKGKELTKDGEKGTFTVKKGYITSKSAIAKIPDYRIEAESLEFLPGHYYIVKDAYLMVKNTEILHIKQYKGRLGKHKKVDLWYLIPRVKSSRNLGIGIYNTMYFLLGKEKNTSFYIGNEWYTKAGYVPDIGFEWDRDAYNLKIHAARVQSFVNEEESFIWKKPSLEFEIKERQIGRTPILIKANGDLGYWSEGAIKGTHFGFNINATSHSINISKNLRLDWLLGYSKEYYGYDKSYRSDKYYSIGIGGTFKKIETGIEYTDHNFEGTTPYKYDNYENIKPVTMSIKVPVTKLDKIELKYVIDTVNGEIKNKYYTYYRDMHSLKGKISYDSVKDRVYLSIDFKDF